MQTLPFEHYKPKKYFSRDTIPLMPLFYRRLSGVIKTL
jgi:hypothetical protein